MSDPFHIRHQVRPAYVAAVVDELSRGPVDQSELSQRVAALGFPPGTLREQVSRLRRLGLVADEALLLTERGQACAQFRVAQPSVFFNALHFHHIGLWDQRAPSSNRFSWSYRAVCSYLWDRHDVRLDTRALLEWLLREVADAFPEEVGVSLSTSSICQVLAWLESLEPPVIRGGRFFRRSFAPPELAILGISRLYDEASADFGDLLHLDSRALRELSVTCLVDDGALSEVLLEAEQRFPWFGRQEGWGYYVRLGRKPAYA